MMRRKHYSWPAQLAMLFALLLPCGMHAQSQELAAHVLQGLQQSQAKIANMCGTVVETRTSQLMEKPMVLHGKFCTEGTERFMLEYAGPHATTVRVNGNRANITQGNKTAGVDIGADIARIQTMIDSPNGLSDMKKSFAISATETSQAYELTLVPLTSAYRRHFNSISIQVGKIDFLPRSFHIDGKSGVDSVFAFTVTSTNTKLPDSMFEVSKTP